jgi:glycerophosphoryl diester phosphodiesterase
MSTHRLFCFGHRGAAGHEPENTLRSVRRALDLGAEGIEVDVHFVDGELIVIHDDTLQRTTNGSGRITDKSFSQLRLLNAGLGERIPTLAEVFEAVAHRALINVELKGPNTAAPVAALIEDHVRQRGWGWEEFILSSFDHAQLKRVKQIAPELRTAALIKSVPRDQAAFAEELGASAVNPSKRCVTPRLIADAHRRGLKVYVYTINEPREIVLMSALGVDGVFSDFPDRVVGR